MVIIFFALIFAMLMFTFSFGAYSMNGINRTVMYIPMEMFQKNVYVLEKNDTSFFYFEEIKLKNDLTEYFTRLEKYTNDYTLTIMFTNAQGKLDLSLRHQGVRITVNATAYFDYNYKKTMFYHVGESNE